MTDPAAAAAAAAADAEGDARAELAEPARTPADAKERAREAKRRGAEVKRRAAEAEREATAAKQRAASERSAARKAAAEAARQQAVAEESTKHAERLAGKVAELRERVARRSGKGRQMASELAELRYSYYLSGAAKKIDVREVDGFRAIAQEALDTGRTRMNFDRLYMLWQAVTASPEDAAVAEVGTFTGGSARFIADALRGANRAPPFYVCDTFDGHPRTDSRYDTRHLDASKFRGVSVDDVAAHLADHPNIEILVGDIFETSSALEGESFGFVHVDVNVYPATDFCLRFFVPRLAPGGLVVVDDYGFVTCPGVKKAVDDFAADTPGLRVFHLLTGQALVLPIAT